MDAETLRSALDFSCPGWRFAQRRVHRAGEAMRALGDWAMSQHVAQALPLPPETLRALYGSDWAVAFEWNAALAHRAIVAPLLASSAADDVT